MMRTVILAACLAAPAAAHDMPCGPTEFIATNLGREGFWPVARGVIGEHDALAQVWLHEESGRFIVLGSGGDGVSCVILGGEAFEVLPPPIPGEPM